MPARVQQRPEHGIAVRQVRKPSHVTAPVTDPELTLALKIVTSSNDADFLDHLVEGMRSANLHDLHGSLDRVSHDRDIDIERVCTTNHQEFIGSINKLDKGRIDCTNLGAEILKLVESYQSSTDSLAGQKKNLVDSRNVRHNIDESSAALKECLEILGLANKVHDLVGKQNHYAALRALDELQSLLKIRESSHYKIGDLIEKSIPATQKMIADAVMADLNSWLSVIRDRSQFIGEFAFWHTEGRRTRHKERAAQDTNLAKFSLNSPVELVADEMEEYDVIEEAFEQLNFDFGPLLKAMHIYEALGQTDRFRTEYSITRRRQKDLIIPSTLRINDEEVSDLRDLLENIAGFCIVEKATQTKAENLRTNADVDELWDSVSSSAVSLMNSAVQSINDADLLLKAVGRIALFLQTMESFGFYANGPNKFLLSLFERYVQLLRKDYSDDMQEILSTDDYMPMELQTQDDYDRVLDMAWYSPENDDPVTFPAYMPFSQMYPMCCHDIREFLLKVYSAPDNYITQSTAIDETIRSSLDDLLCNKIHATLIERLKAQNLAQIVQILPNFRHFVKACKELQLELAQTRASRSKAGPVTLKATELFETGQQKARERVFELVNSKIAMLTETAEYDWTSRDEPDEPSDYMTELTQWLHNTMNSVLLNLPPDTKDMIYFDSLNHAASSILELPLDPGVPAITPQALHLFRLDVSHLSKFVSTLSLPTAVATASSSSTDIPASAQQNPTVFRRTLDELNQTVALMSSDNPDEFFDISQRSRKYAAVDAQNGALLLEKVDKGKKKAAAPVEVAPQPERLKASDRFGNVMRGFRS